MSYVATFARYEDNPVRQAAYQLWAADPSAPTTDVGRLLEAELGEKVAYRTLADWRKRDQWELRYAEEEAARSGILVIEHVKRLRVAAPTHVSYLDRVASGEEKYDRGRVEVAKFLVTEAGRFLSLLPSVQLPAPPAEIPDSVSDDDLLEYEARLAAGETGTG